MELQPTPEREGDPEEGDLRCMYKGSHGEIWSVYDSVRRTWFDLNSKDVALFKLVARMCSK